jgi:hypothetical protein
MSRSCQYCGCQFLTEQGLAAHTSRVDACRIAFRQEISALKAKRRRGEDCPGELDVTPNSLPADVHQPSAEPPSKRQRTTIEDVEDEEGPQYYKEEFEGAGQVYGRAQTQFERYKSEQEKRKLEPWAPYRDKDEWELVQWLVKHRVTQRGIDAYLRLKIVSYATV